MIMAGTDTTTATTATGKATATTTWHRAKTVSQRVHIA